MNTEYEIWNLMYLGFISNAMFMVAMVLLTWLGFRFAARIYDDSNANLAAKVTATVFYLLVGIMFYNTAQIGGAIIGRQMSNDFKAPCRTTRVPREIPGEVPWYRLPPVQMC